MTVLQNTTAGRSPDQLGKALNRKIFWKITPIVLLCYIVCYLDRVNVGFAKLQMVGDLRLNDTVYALGASIFFWGYVILEVPSNMMLHKFGARRWIARIMVSWGIISIATMYIAPLAHVFCVGNATMFYIMRFLLGACEAGFFPGVILYVNYWLPSHRQNNIMAGFLVALPLSLVIGSPLSGWLLEATHGAFGLQGWQWLFAIEGIPAIVMALIVFFWLDDDISRARWLTEPQKQHLLAQLREEQSDKTYHFSAAVRDYRVWLLVGIVFTYDTGFYGLSFWLPSIIHASGVQSTFAIGVLSAIPFAVAAVFMMVNAAHSNRTGERRWHAAIPAFMGGFGLILSAMFANNVPVSVFFLCFAASGILGLMPVVWTYPGRLLSGTAAAAGIAMINCLGNLSGISGAMITGVAKTMTGDINDGTYVLGGFVVLTGLFVLAIPARLFTWRHDVAVPVAEGAVVPVRLK